MLSLKSALIIAIMSIIMAVLLGLAEKIGTRKRGFDSLQIRDGILVGLGQTLALIPGVSRSGSNIDDCLIFRIRTRYSSEIFIFVRVSNSDHCYPV